MSIVSTDEEREQQKQEADSQEEEEATQLYVVIRPPFLSPPYSPGIHRIPPNQASIFAALESGTDSDDSAAEEEDQPKIVPLTPPPRRTSTAVPSSAASTSTVRPALPKALRFQPDGTLARVPSDGRIPSVLSFSSPSRYPISND